eukprot:symbB.v1.2.025526.t1/scaffold2480.1/size78183/8
MASLRLSVWCSAEAFRWARELHDASTLWTKREALRKSALRCSASRSTVRGSSSDRTFQSTTPQESWPKAVEEEEYALDSGSSLFSPSESEVDEAERWFENENKCESEEEFVNGSEEVETLPSHTASAPSLRRPPLMPSRSGPLATASSAPSLPQVDDFRAEMAEAEESECEEISAEEEEEEDEEPSDCEVTEDEEQEEPQPVEIEKKEEEHVEEVVEIESKEEETVEEDGFIDSQSLAWNVCEL